jgi:hypothetical protein
VTVQRRNVLGPPNSYDNGLKPASFVDGGDRSLDARQNYTAPLSVTDTTSDETRAEREGLENAFKAAQRAAASVTNAGAGGAVVAPAGQFERLGEIPTSSADVIAANRLVTRSDGADRGDTGAGKAIG